MNPQEGSPNNLGVFSWAPLYRNSVRQQFCSQTWVAGRWPFDVCWAPLVLTGGAPEQGRGHWRWVWDCSGQQPGVAWKATFASPWRLVAWVKVWFTETLSVPGGVSDKRNPWLIGKDVLWTQSTQAWGCKLAAVGRVVRKCGTQIEVSGIRPDCVSRPWGSCVSLFISEGAHGVRVTIPGYLLLP